MRFYKFGMIVVATFGLAVSGCGGPKDVKVSVQSSEIIANARKTLEEFEKTGKLGSGMTGLESDINGIKSSDSAKGEALTNAYRQLQGLTAPADIKQKAKEMIGLL